MSTRYAAPSFQDENEYVRSDRSCFAEPRTSAPFDGIEFVFDLDLDLQSSQVADGLLEFTS